MKNYLQKTIFILSIIIFFNSCKDPDVNPVDPGFPLDPVQNFTSELTSDHEVTLSWQKHSDAITYLLTKYVSGEVVPVLIEELPKNQTEYYDEFLSVDHTYKYHIQAKADENLSGSDSVIVNPSFDQISTLTLSPSNDYSSLNISWSHDCDYESGYTIEMENTLGEVSEIATLIADQTSYSYEHSNWPMIEGATFTITAFSDHNSSNPKEKEWNGISIISNIQNETINQTLNDTKTIIINQGSDHDEGSFTYDIFTDSDDIELEFISYNEFTVTSSIGSNIGNNPIQVHAYMGEQLIDEENFIVHLIYDELADTESNENTTFTIDLSDHIPADYTMPHVYLDGGFSNSMINEDASYFNESNQEYNILVEQFPNGTPNWMDGEQYNQMIEDIGVIIQNNASSDIESTQMPLSFDLNILQVNDPPTINFEVGSSDNIEEDEMASYSVIVDISDPEFSSTNLEESDSLSYGINSNSSDIFLSELNFDGEIFLAIEIPENEYGETNIELYAIDDYPGSDTTFSTFTLTIESVNDSPWITGDIEETQLAGFTTLEEDPDVQKINLTGLALNDVEEGDLVFLGQSNNQSLVKDKNISYSAETDELSIPFEQNANGSVIITILAEDSGSEQSVDGNIDVEFTLAAVNDNPVLEWIEGVSDSFDISIADDAPKEVDLLSLFTVLDVEGDNTDFIVSEGDEVFTISYADNILTIDLETDAEEGNNILINIQAMETDTEEPLDSNILTLTVTAIE